MVTPMTAHAGWSGSGGRLSNDGDNPWWVGNTTRIAYCIQTDARNFGIPIDRLQELVPKALGYWQRNLANAFKTWSWDDGNSVPAPENDIAMKVGGQTFYEVPCTTEHDLTFQFGVMSPEQIQKLGEFGAPQDYVGLAIRTDYDQLQMRGKGFVYIAPEYGELMPNLRDLQPRVWSANGEWRFMRVLIHELGHVFGIQHWDTTYAATGEYGLLMSADYPEFLVKWGFEALYESMPLIPTDFFPYPFEDSTRLNSGRTGEPLRIGRTNAEYLGVRLEADRNYCQKWTGTWQDSTFWVRDCTDGPGDEGWQNVGQLVMRPEEMTCHAKFALQIFLPREQRVTQPSRNQRLPMGQQCILNGQEQFKTTFTVTTTGHKLRGTEGWIEYRDSWGTIDTWNLTTDNRLPFGSINFRRSFDWAGAGPNLEIHAFAESLRGPAAKNRPTSTFPDTLSPGTLLRP
jgi:hypothetical protein